MCSGCKCVIWVETFSATEIEPFDPDVMEKEHFASSIVTEKTLKGNVSGSVHPSAEVDEILPE